MTAPEIQGNDRQPSIEVALRQSEARFQKLMANVPGVVYQFLMKPDGSTHFPFFGIGCQQLFELDPKAFQENANQFLSIIHPDDRLSLDETVAHSMQTLAPWKWEGRFLLASGQTKWIEASAQPELQPDGSVLWDGLFMDVTRYKEATVELERCVEERTHKLQKAIAQLQNEISERQHIEAKRQKSEELIRIQLAAIESAMDGIGILNDQGKYLYLNKTHIELFGYQQPEELLGKTWHILYEQSEIDRLQQVAFPHLEQYGRWRGEAIARRQDGTPVEEELSLTLIDGVGLICVCRDISDRLRVENERKQAEAELKQSEQQLRQKATDLENTLHELGRTQTQLLQSEKMSSLGQLVAGVAHEVNNPVNFIFGNLCHAQDYIQDLLRLVQLYQKHYPQPLREIQREIETIDLPFVVEDLPRLLSSMKVGADRIQKIVASLRNFSRMDEAEMKAVDVHEGIDSTLLILQNRLKPKPDRPAIEVIQNYGKLPLVECYAGQLNQVFMNILSNAIDTLDEKIALERFSTQEQNTPNLHAKITPQIRIETKAIGSNRVQICIADNGRGIPETHRHRIFDPFFTTKPVGKGTGLGMSISYQIITEKHGGSLVCNSAIGQGTEFVIDIPIRQS